MNLIYHHSNCRSDFTPAKIAKVLGCRNNLVISLTPTHIIARGYDEITKKNVAMACLAKNWRHAHCWSEISPVHIEGEMRFVPLNNLNPGHYPDGEVLWSKARDFVLEAKNIVMKEVL